MDIVNNCIDTDTRRFPENNQVFTHASNIKHWSDNQEVEKCEEKQEQPWKRIYFHLCISKIF